jgi:hypothetical protein
MPVSVRIDPIGEDIQLLVSDLLSPEAQGRQIAIAAREILADAEQTNLQAVGHIPPHDTFVDGRLGVAEEMVRPSGGTIVYEFELLDDLFAWIGDQLVIHSPVLTGKFARSFLFFADGIEIDPAAPVPLDATEFAFLNSQPYARKIERGESPQAPDGVFQSVAALAQRRFGNVAKVRFEWRAIAGGAILTGRHGNRSSDRTPAIVINLLR